MKRKYSLTELDGICYRLECAVCNLDAVYVAIAESPYAPETYNNALFFASGALGDLCKELREFADGCIHNDKEGK